MKNDNKDMSCFCELSENELFEIKAGGLGLCIIGAIGGGLSGALGGAVVTPFCPPLGAALGAISGGGKMGIKGWKK